MINKPKIVQGFKGRYCTICNTVWEMAAAPGSVGILVKHPDFPTYGLERKNCAECENNYAKKELAG